MLPPTRARLSGLAVSLPAQYRTMEKTREEIARQSPFVPPPGALEDLTGIRGVHVREAGEQASDLAVSAATKAMAEAGVGAGDLDLLLFASCCQDLIEPATAHIVAAKLGAGCPVFDVKNACNSVLNALEVASAFIESGRYATVLIACGETPTMTTRWRVPDQEAFLRALPGYTLSDAGAALLLTAGPAGADDPGVLTTHFGADSTAWDACTVESGGSLHFRPADDEPTYIRLNGDLLRSAALDMAPRAFGRVPEELRRARESAFIAFHQISRRQYDEVLTALDLPADRCLPTVADHGNTASASLPLQLVRARESDRTEPGDQVALIGMASGFSAGLAIIRL
ncbi:3-oxoacyl-ACP synthase [Streptomyces sp. CB03234]|uniref:3-oxoacyl-ACP synthase III family protein n=1 Tax=Streptomyces sp. (strain CB03234) TaxID=1703937 RepID=UPI00093D530C|nr:3-oxoacyl-[acyl-carrier-protein] synthase III C-terminal domain-containing protein [Streptomyces sp. CB03234]OKJ95138.1 3-oxoacyl-ACP synthase [Streptomyces sp. CB03234]